MLDNIVMSRLYRPGSVARSQEVGAFIGTAVVSMRLTPRASDPPGDQRSPMCQSPAECRTSWPLVCRVCPELVRAGQILTMLVVVEYRYQ